MDEKAAFTSQKPIGDRPLTALEPPVERTPATPRKGKLMTALKVLCYILIYMVLATMVGLTAFIMSQIPYYCYPQWYVHRSALMNNLNFFQEREHVLSRRFRDPKTQTVKYPSEEEITKLREEELRIETDRVQRLAVEYSINAGIGLLVGLTLLLCLRNLLKKWPKDASTADSSERVKL